MNLEFPLPPFDIEHPNRTAPVADFVGYWKQEAWLCRVCNGILHFRRAEHEGFSPIFAVAPPLSTDLEEAPDLWPLLWEEAMSTQRFARFVLFPYRGSFDRDFPFYLGLDGSGWMRELWNRDDCAFQGGFSRTLAQFGQDDDLLSSVEEIFNETVLPWLEKQVPPAPMDDADVEWLCGSLEELSRVARAICALEPLFLHRETKLWFFAETAFTRAHLWRGAPQPHTSQSQLSKRFWTLMELALDFNTPTGIYWEYHDQGAGRAAYSPHSASFRIEVFAASNHERVEAVLFLREWLRDKAAPDEIEALLSG